MRKEKILSDNQLLNTFKAQRRYSNIAFGVSVVITVVCIIIGVVFSDSNSSNFICSCAVGLSCGYITGWVSSYFADKQTACLLEIDYKISKIDEFINKCDFGINIFPYNSDQPPQKVNIFNCGESTKNYFACLCRMGGVFREIAECDIADLSNIIVDFYIDDENVEKIKIGDFGERLGLYCMEQNKQYKKVNWSMKQCNNMFGNSMNVKYELNKIKKDFIKEKELTILGEKKAK